MKVLIIYATAGVTTRTCAEMLAQKLKVHHEPTLVNIRESLPSLSDYDAIVLGSSIRMGQMNKMLKKYIRVHKETLSSLPTAVFFCCGYPKQFQEYVDIQLPKDLICSLGTHCFGGELKPEKRKGFDKLAVKLMRNAIRTQDFEESDADHHDLPEIIPENINLLVEKIEKYGKI